MKKNFRVKEDELQKFILSNEEEFIPIKLDENDINIDNKNKVITKTMKYIYDLKNEKFITMNFKKLKELNFIY